MDWNIHDRDEALARVDQNGLDLRHLPEHLRADKAVVLAAVEQDGWALDFASEDLRADKAVVLAALRLALQGRCQTAW